MIVNGGKMNKTEENLKAAFSGESQARNKYMYFAKVARKQGYQYIAKIFEETAENEVQHAKEEFKLLKGIGDTAANLKAAIEGENYEQVSENGLVYNGDVGTGRRTEWGGIQRGVLHFQSAGQSSGRGLWIHRNYGVKQSGAIVLQKGQKPGTTGRAGFAYQAKGFVEHIYGLLGAVCPGRNGTFLCAGS